MYCTVYLQSLKCSLENNIVFKSNKNGESCRARKLNSFLFIFYSNKNTKERKFTSWKKTKKIFLLDSLKFYSDKTRLDSLKFYSDKTRKVV